MDELKMDTAIPSCLLNMENMDLSLAKIEARLSKLEAPTCKREKMVEKIAQTINKAVSENEDWKREEIRKSKDEHDAALTEIQDVRKSIKDLLREKSKQLGTEEEFQSKLRLIEDCVKSLTEEQKDIQNRVDECRNDLKKRYDANTASNLYFQQNLNCYLEVNDVEDRKITLYLFSMKKADNYFVELRCVDGQWILVRTEPPLEGHVDLEKKLEETGDILGLLVSIRKEFVHLKESLS